MYLHAKTAPVQTFQVNKDFGDSEDFFRLITPYGEVQLKKLPFQKDKPLPDSLSCKVKQINGATPIISHNMPEYVSNFYADGFSKGQTFDFKVVGKPYDGNQFYRLEDEHGLLFKLKAPKSSMSIGQTVKCKFKVLDHAYFELKRADDDVLFRMLVMRDIAKMLRVKPYIIESVERKMREMPVFDKTFEELDRGMSTWVFTLLRTIRANIMPLFQEAMAAYSADTVRQLLGACCDLALYMLEGSDFLRNVKGSERNQLQSELTSQIEQLSIYVDAVDIIARKEQASFIDMLLRHLKESGFIYHPTEQFTILMILFRMSPDLVNRSLGRIFDTLLEWYPDTWKTEPFRQAFVEQLEIYISQTRDDIDKFLVPTTAADNEKIEKVLTAIAIQQALAQSTDRIDLKLNMSLFYRCLSLLRRAKSGSLLKKSLLELMDVKLPVDFTWSEIKEPTMMMTRAAVDPPVTARVSETPRVYVPELCDNVEVVINDEGVSVNRVDQDANGQVPNGMLPWPMLQVCVDLEHPINRTRIRTIEGHADFWNEVENSLFAQPEAKQAFATTKRHAAIDDEVRIVVDRVISSASDPNRIEGFHCKIVDDYYLDEGGIMMAEDLVLFNLYGVTVGSFRGDDGSELVFTATVKDIDENDVIYFSLLEAARQAVPNLVSTGDQCYAVVTKDNGRSYSAISDKGFGLYIKKEHGVTPYRSGNVVLVSVTSIDNNIVQGVVEEGPIDGKFLNNAQSLHYLLLELAENEGSDEIDYDEEELMPRAEMIEIIQILRYKAIAESDNIMLAFDYLSYARLLARLVDDKELAATIKAHKDVLLLHAHYAKNKQIFRDDILKLRADVPGSRLIERLSSKLMIVSSLGHPEDNNDLWALVNDPATADKERNLAQMVLSYNMLSDVNRDADMVGAIKDNIATLLNVSNEQSNLKYYGSESQYVEFKSTLVYPAQKGKAGISMADPDKQEFEILSIIAGFLNTTGGSLYIGVNDDHYERGLEEDFKFYRLDTSEKNNMYRRSIRSLDNMANYLQNLIDKSFNLGTNAGEYSKVFIDDESTKGVIVVKVNPCPRVVYLKDTIYVRHSAKTTPILIKEEIEQFVTDRPRLYKLLDESTLRKDDKPATVKGQALQLSSSLVKDETIESTESTDAPETPAAQPAIDGALATSALRHNVLHEYLDPEHFVAPLRYVRFVGDNEFIVTRDEWSFDDQNDRLVLAIREDEADAFMVMAYEGGYVIKVPMKEILQKKLNSRNSHYADRKIVFAVPAKADEAIYSLHTNAKGMVYERLTPVDSLPQGFVGTAPERLFEAECVASPLWEVLDAPRAAEFASIKSSLIKKTQLGSTYKAPPSVRITPQYAIDDFYSKIQR